MSLEKYDYTNNTKYKTLLFSNAWISQLPSITQNSHSFPHLQNLCGKGGSVFVWFCLKRQSQLFYTRLSFFPNHLTNNTSFPVINYIRNRSVSFQFIWIQGKEWTDGLRQGSQSVWLITLFHTTGSVVHWYRQAS